MSRNALDFYETPPWQTRALVKRVPIRGTILECCAGDGSICKTLTEFGINAAANDIDTARDAHFHADATLDDSWERFGKHDWVITNPPFNCAIDILNKARANLGVAMLLRLSFLEPTPGTKRFKGRAAWLCANPPTRIIVLPRWSYTGDGKTDSVTTAWMIWSRFVLSGIDVVPISEKGVKKL